MSGRTPPLVRPRTYSARPIVVLAPDLAGRLVETMAARGLTVRELEARTGVNKATISAWRTGAQARVRVDAVDRVAAALGTTVEDLLDMAPPSPPTASGQSEEIVGRLTALGPTLASLSADAPALSPALERHAQRLAEIARVLAQVDDLAAAATESRSGARGTKSR